MKKTIDQINSVSESNINTWIHITLECVKWVMDESDWG